jgi:hypothetical protein
MELIRLKGHCLLILTTLIFGSCKQAPKVEPTVKRVQPSSSATPEIYEYTGMQIELVDPEKLTLQNIMIKGSFRILVKPGAANSIWKGFPEGIVYTLTDTISGKKFKSINRSKPANTDFSNGQAKDEFQEKHFNHNLSDFLPKDFPTNRAEYDIYASWLGRDSETIRVQITGR